MVSSSYPVDSRDWRSRFIADMLAALARNNGLRLSFWGPPGDVPQNVQTVAADAERSWLGSLMQRGGLAHLIRQNRVRGALTAATYLWKLHRACQRHAGTMNVAHINWLQNALALWRTDLPAVVTVLGSDYGLLRHGIMTRLLRIVLRRRRCILAPNAQWMAATLEQRFGDLAQVTPVPFGVDASWFDVPRARDSHAPGKWLVISRVTQKKLGPLLEWGDGLFGPQRELHLLGPNQESLRLPSWVHYHGPTFPAEIKSQWFPRATGLITLSQHDEGRPQVLLEAMAAGLPVIASSLPAHRDAIRHGDNGFLVDSRATFAEALDTLSDELTATAVGQRAKAYVKDNLGTWLDTARRYDDLYRQLLSEAA